MRRLLDFAHILRDLRAAFRTDPREAELEYARAQLNGIRSLCLGAGWPGSYSVELFLRRELNTLHDFRVRDALREPVRASLEN